MIAACLLTCNRPELTEQSATSFAQHNPSRDDIALLHCDGGSDSLENAWVASRAGFTTIFSSSHRVGQMETLRAFLGVATTIRADWILWLENDWVSEAPLPEAAFFDSAAADGVETIRLFGERKMRGDSPRAPAGAHRMGTKERIDWQACKSVPGWESGSAHWACGGSLIRTDILTSCAQMQGLKQIMLAKNNLLSLRPKQNLMWSIGAETTPGFMP